MGNAWVPLSPRSAEKAFGLMEKAGGGARDGFFSLKRIADGPIISLTRLEADGDGGCFGFDQNCTRRAIRRQLPDVATAEAVELAEAEKAERREGGGGGGGGGGASAAANAARGARGGGAFDVNEGDLVPVTREMTTQAAAVLLRRLPPAIEVAKVAGKKAADGAPTWLLANTLATPPGATLAFLLP